MDEKQSPNKINETADKDINFYKELDEKNSRHSCCNLPALIILLIIMFVLGMMALFFIRGTFAKNMGALRNNPTDSIFKKITASVPAIKNIGGNKLSLSLTDSDLTKLVEAGFSFDELVIKSPQIVIDSHEIFLYANLSAPFNATVVEKVEVEIVDGRIKLKSKEIKAGKINLPDSLAQKMMGSINDRLENRLNYISNLMIVEELQFGDRSITIMGRKK